MKLFLVYGQRVGVAETTTSLFNSTGNIATIVHGRKHYPNEHIIGLLFDEPKVLSYDRESRHKYFYAFETEEEAQAYIKEMKFSEKEISSYSRLNKGDYTGPLGSAFIYEIDINDMEGIEDVGGNIPVLNKFEDPKNEGYRIPSDKIKSCKVISATLEGKKYPLNKDMRLENNLTTNTFFKRHDTRYKSHFFRSTGIDRQHIKDVQGIYQYTGKNPKSRSAEIVKTEAARNHITFKDFRDAYLDQYEREYLKNPNSTMRRMILLHEIDDIDAVYKYVDENPRSRAAKVLLAMSEDILAKPTIPEQSVACS